MCRVACVRQSLTEKKKLLKGGLFHFDVSMTSLWRQNNKKHEEKKKQIGFFFSFSLFFLD